MKRTALYITVLVFASLVGYGFSTSVHAADAISDQKAGDISTHCNQLKNQLAVIISTETALRVNRGRTYDTKVSALMAAFNSRIAANKVNAPQLISVAADFQTYFKQFQSNFNVYADDLSNSRATDCVSDPQGFYNWIVRARIDRANLADSLNHLDQTLDSYLSELNNLKERYQK